MRTLIFALSWLVCAGVVTLPALADAGGTEPHPFNAHDLHSMHRLTGPQASPQGDQAVFVLRTTDFAANKGRTHLVRVALDGSGLTPLTDGAFSDSEPRWSADGRSLYFLSTRSGSSQVWRLAADAGGKVPGGAPVQVTNLPLDVGSFRLAPDGRHLVFAMEVFVDCPDLACTKDRLDKRAAAGQPSGQLYDQLFVRHWDTWSNGTRSHLFAVPVEGGGQPIDLTRGLDADVPSKPDGGAEEYNVSPDGRSVVFAARTAGREEPWSTNFDLYQVPIDASAAPKNLTVANPAWDTQPLFSPDGKTLAYLAMSRPGFEADRFRIVLLSLADGRSRVLTEDWDRSPGELFFSPDGKTLYCTAMDVGHVALFAVDVATGKVKTVVRQGSVHAPSWAGGRLLFGLDDLRHPVDLHTARPDGSDLKKLTDVNRAELAAVKMGEPQPFQFAGAQGDTVHGFVVKPVGFEPGKRYPVALLIHGGPQGSFHDEFHYRWNPQIYAGAGYGVVEIDFHGSTGYGQAFTDAIRGHWGDGPLEDLQKGLAAALTANPWMDGDKVGALGASYGGFMTNWIAGNWPDRFRCLVTHDGIFDQRMMYYSTEELWFPEWEMGGPYFTHPDTYERFNPVRFVDRWKTPMLIVHGGLDFRIPMTQGLAAFTALERRGIPSRFLYFPDENHFVLKPANALLWHETVLGWLDRWLKPAAAK